MIEVLEKPEAADGTKLTLRVLTGPLAGAEGSLSEDSPVSIGRGFRNEIVLRDVAIGEARVTLRLQGGAARLKVAEGSVRFLGQTLTAPAESVLPPFLPVWIGASAFAYGKAGSPRWDEAQELAADAATAGAPAPRRRKRTGWASGLGLGACAFSVLTMTAFLSAGTEARPSPIAVVTDALAQAGFSGLAVEAGPGEEVSVSGSLPTDARRAELRALLAELDVMARADVRTAEATVRSVTDLFAAADVPVSARLDGDVMTLTLLEEGTVDAATVEGLRDRALADLPQLSRIEVVGETATEPGSTLPFTAQVASLVAGPSGYVVTRDGARYFVGAALPTGGRLVGIAEGSIVVQEDGTTRSYAF
jgi:type III secretion protein D